MIGTWRVLEHHLMVYRRTWKGGMFVSFASPILFLAAMGIGLGSLIARGPVRTVGGVSYLAFLAPGLLAATAMQTAFVEETYPIMAKLQWLRTYDGMLATPLTIGNLLGGEIGWLAVRQAITAIAFFIVLVIFGTVSSVAAVLMVPVAVLNGLAFGLPIMAFSAREMFRDHLDEVLAEYQKKGKATETELGPIKTHLERFARKKRGKEQNLEKRNN